MQQRLRCGEHFEHLLTSAGVEHAKMFTSSAKGAGLFYNLVNPDLTPCSCTEEALVEMTKTLMDWTVAYHNVMDDNKEMLAQSEIGSRVVAGGGFEPLATRTLVRQGELPDIFALSNEQFDEADSMTFDAAKMTELVRMPIIDGTKLGTKQRKLTGWHHVREATQGKFATEWNYTRLTPAECLRVSDECWRWLETQDS